MKKEEFKEKTLQILNDMHEIYLKDAEKVIDSLDDDYFKSFENNYFAPKAFCAALRSVNHPVPTQNCFSASFVRAYNKLHRKFINVILYNK